MSTITILGLGPGDAGLLTRAAWELLQATDVLYLRTAVHPTVAALPARIELRPFDALYESAQEFGAIYNRIADELIERALHGEAIVYAVPGHPLVAEATTRRLLALARERQVPARIVPGLSFVDPVCAALELDPLEQGLQLLDALDLIPSFEFSVLSSQLSRSKTQNSKLKTQNSDGAWCEVQGIGPYSPPLLPFPLTPTRPVLICQLYSRHVASHVKLSLMERYPAEHPVTLVRAAGVAAEERVWSVPLYQLDHQPELDHLTCAYVAPLAPLADLRGPEGAAYVVARLLGRHGCPWDREQTHQSLRADLLEETHEVLEALDAHDTDALAEELGDLLLHVLMHGEIARQAGEFDLGDVYGHIAAKLIRRHPHIFGATDAADSGEVLRNWDSIKHAERAAKGQAPRGALDGVPRSMPALATAQELTRKAAKIMPDQPDLRAAWTRLDTAIAGLRAADAAGQAGPIEDALGDLLFAVANLARRLHLDAESALRAANARFRRRFDYVEEQARLQGRDLPSLDADEQAALWDQAKTQTG